MSENYGEDDTPRAFQRLLQLQNNKRRLAGLDDGEGRPAAKKTKPRPSNVVDTIQTHEEVSEAPRLLPGERLADFSARVNQALPVGGLARKGKVKIEGVKERRTRTEKRLHKMYAEWRKEDTRRKEKEEEQAEQAEEDAEDRLADYGGQSLKLPAGRRAKRKKAIGESGETEEDPWAVLKSKREAPKGLHDVAQAPPEFKVAPKEKLHVRNGARVDVANVPVAAGSLKKREELSKARGEVIERYRAMMKGAGNK